MRERELDGAHHGGRLPSCGLDSMEPLRREGARIVYAFRPLLAKRGRDFSATCVSRRREQLSHVEVARRLRDEGW